MRALLQGLKSGLGAPLISRGWMVMQPYTTTGGGGGGGAAGSVVEMATSATAAEAAVAAFLANFMAGDH